MKVYVVESCNCEGGEVLGVCSTVEVAQKILQEYLDDVFDDNQENIIEDTETDKWNNNIIKMYICKDEYNSGEPIVCITEWEVQEK